MKVQVGVWDGLVVEAKGPWIKVTLNGTLVNDDQSSRQQSLYMCCKRAVDRVRNFDTCGSRS